MKKYVKPELFFEQFELSQHIADCALDYVDPNGEKTSTNADSCIAYTDADLWGYVYPVFTSANDNCAEKFNGYCETVSTNGMNTFTS